MPDRPFVTYELLHPVPELRGQAGDVLIFEELTEEPISLVLFFSPDLIPLMLRLEEEGVLRALNVSDPPPDLLNRPRLAIVS